MVSLRYEGRAAGRRGEKASRSNKGHFHYTRSDAGIKGVGPYRFFFSGMNTFSFSSENWKASATRVM
jgi:hypothetical protein